jgi:hypothetical protein
LTESTLWKCVHHQKQSTCSMQFLQKFQWHLYRDRKINPKIHMKHKSPWIAKTIMRKNSNAGGNTMPNFKLYYRAFTVKTAWYCPINRHEKQWTRTEELDINPWNYSQRILDRGVQNIQ